MISYGQAMYAIQGLIIMEIRVRPKTKSLLIKKKKNLQIVNNLKQKQRFPQFGSMKITLYLYILYTYILFHIKRK